jgi:DNA-binding MarR family transcriptional regulator
MARAHEQWVVELLAGLSRRERDELLKLLAKVKSHAVEVVS